MPKDGIYLEFKAGSVLAMLSALSAINMLVLHEDLGEEMIQIIQERFFNGQDVWGVPFKPIQAYVYSFGKIKRRRKPGDKPLKAGLRNPSLSRSFESEASSSEVLVGTPYEDAKFHSDYPDNNQNPRKVIPLREFMGIELESDYARLIGVVEDHYGTIAEARGNWV